MAETTYQNRTSNLSDARAFSANEGRSIKLENLAEERRQEALRLQQPDSTAGQVKTQSSSFFQHSDSAETERQLLIRLSELNYDEDYDEDFLPPSKLATESTRNMLIQAYRILPNFTLLPKFITADGDGGIRVQWQKAEKELRLICNAVGELKIYWQTGKEYGLDESKVLLLAERIKSLI